MSQLEWPGHDLSVDCVDGVWRIVEHDQFLPPDLPATVGDEAAAVVLGPVVGSLQAMAAAGVRFDVVYLDLPRPDFMQADVERLRTSTWLTVVATLARLSSQVCHENGLLVVHVDDVGAAEVSEVLARELPEWSSDAVFWQTKYSPQNDAKGRVTAAHDVVFLCREPRSAGGAVAWPYQFAGKAEDAIKNDYKPMRKSGALPPDAEMPKAAKPARLVDRILEQDGRDRGRTLEVLADSCFWAGRALEKGWDVCALVDDSVVPLYRSTGRHRLAHAASVRAEEFEEATVRLHELGVERRDVPTSREPEGRISFDLEWVPPPAEGHALDLRGASLEVSGSRFPSLTIAGSPVDGLLALEPLARVGMRAAIVRFEGDRGGPSTLMAASRCVTTEGLLALVTPWTDYSRAKLVADAVIGRGRYAGTLVVTDADKTPGSVERLVLLYHNGQSGVERKVGFSRLVEDYHNPDGDPRGPWRVPGFKGARSGNRNTRYDIRVPPYRWRVVEGDLPPGVWRLSPDTGVLFAERLAEAGRYQCTVEVSDSLGNASRRLLELEVVDAVGDLEDPSVWFLREDPRPSGGAPEICSRPPRGHAGYRYATVLRAQGGAPYDEVKHLPSNRFWECTLETLEAHVLHDRADFGSTGTASPSWRRYAADEPDSVKVELGWWSPGRLAGEEPMSRLVRMLCPRRDDAVLVVHDVEVAEVARRLERPTVHVAGEVATGDVRPRPVITDGPWGVPELLEDWSSSSLLLSYEGFFPRDSIVEGEDDGPDGVSWDLRDTATLLPADVWATTEKCRRLADMTGASSMRHTTYFYRSHALNEKGLRVRRIPFDLRFRTGES